MIEKLKKYFAVRHMKTGKVESVIGGLIILVSLALFFVRPEVTWEQVMVGVGIGAGLIGFKLNPDDEGGQNESK